MSKRAETFSVKRVRTLPKLRARRKDAHKGDFGRVLVVSGSVGMLGAPSLVGLAAQRSGAGLVTVAVPKSIQSAVATLCPCATTIGLPESASGQIEPAAALDHLRHLGLLGEGGGAPDVLITGPGVGRGAADFARQFWELINAFRGSPHVPAVIDADALNLTRRSSHEYPGGWDDQRHYRTVITPHPGELARMHGVTTQEIQADREGFAVRTAKMMAATCEEPDFTPVVVLKGAGTIVTDGNRLYVNRTGNAGMATGGSGDVLAGIIGALIGQRLEPFEAAVLGVHVHGLAGDLAARHLGQVSLIATDLIDHLPAAFLKIGAGR
jgi:hydroxyethylthiazole kinase-like uncharacterized protein yjeF